MIQPKLEFADGRSWEEVYGVEDIKEVCFLLLDKLYDYYTDKGIEPYKDRFETFKREIGYWLGDFDSFDSIYFYGYTRYNSADVGYDNTLKRAFQMCVAGEEDNYFSPKFVIDPYEKKIYYGRYWRVNSSGYLSL